MADTQTNKSYVEGSNYQETDLSMFITTEVDGGLEISRFTGNELTHVAIPNEIDGKKVVKIREYAFFECKTLTSVEIPNSVTSIGECAFWNCTGLTSIVIPNSVTKIGTSAFSHCTNLTSIVIPNSVTKIGKYAFNDCKALKKVVIPESVKSIGASAFADCNNLAIYCKAKKKPLFGWSWSWNSSDCLVFWDYKEN